ncbi:MAG TPA: sigma-70 family RNA polymerase sigma factor [Bacillota bacterium]|nr:sigma-70 family RNA polymerase sigma factor [Bacillota bacterium]
MEEITLNELSEEYGSYVSLICRRMLRDEELAKDAAQEVWCQVIKSFPNFQGRSQVSTWLYSITTRVVMNLAKKEQVYSIRFLRRYFHGEPMEAPYEEEYENKLWIREMCDKCLSGITHCLDNKSRLAYLLRDVAQLSYQQLASIMGEDSGNLRQKVVRARRKLRNFLLDECRLYNSKGKCQCRLNKLVAETDLPQEYEKLRHLAARVNFFLASEQVMPGRNYWENLI